MAVIAFETGLAVHAMAGIAILFAAMAHMRIWVHLFGASSNLFIRAVALEAGFFGRRLEGAIRMASRARHCGVRAVDRNSRRSVGAGAKAKRDERGRQHRFNVHDNLL